VKKDYGTPDDPQWVDLQRMRRATSIMTFAYLILAAAAVAWGAFFFFVGRGA
jgi:hypothetical protein